MLVAGRRVRQQRAIGGGGEESGGGTGGEGAPAVQFCLVGNTAPRKKGTKRTLTSLRVV